MAVRYDDNSTASWELTVEFTMLTSTSPSLWGRWRRVSAADEGGTPVRWRNRQRVLMHSPWKHAISVYRQGRGDRGGSYTDDSGDGDCRHGGDSIEG